MRQRWQHLFFCSVYLLCASCTNLFPPAPIPTSSLQPSPIVTRTESQLVVTYPDYPNAFHHQLEVDNPIAFDRSQRETYFEYVQNMAKSQQTYQGNELIIYGPENSGGTITVKGKTVQLPDDAFPVLLQNREYSTDRCMMQNTPCPALPYYMLARGDATIMVEQKSGKIFSVLYASHEAARHDFAQFQFLFDALQE